MIYIKRFNLCFVSIPKNASQSIRQFIIKEMVNNNEDIVEGYDGHIHKTHYGSRSIIRNALAPRNAKFIGVIREPLERQLSAYLYCVKRYMKDSYPTGFFKPGLDHFKEIYQPYNLTTDGRPVFWEFMNKMGSEPQSTYIDQGLNHEFWLYENLEDHIENFKKEYDIRPDAFLDKINNTHEEDDVTTKSLIDKFYDEELKDIIRKQYANDFKLYNELKDGRYPR
jgi:hypothetical protein